MKDLKHKKINDKIQKRMAYGSINEFLGFIGVKSDIVESLTVEYVDVADTRIADYVGLERDGSIRLLEFYTGAPDENLDFKMFDYSSMIYKKYRKPVNPLAICTEEIKEPEGYLDWGDKNRFHYDIVTFKDINGDKELNNIRDKNKINEGLSSREIITLKLILYTSYDGEPQDVMLDACKLTNEANLAQEDRDEIKKFQELTCRKMIDEQYHRGIADVIAMKNSLFYEDMKKSEERGIKIGEERGEERGIEIGAERKEFDYKVKTIKKFLGTIPYSELAEFLELTEEELDKFIDDNDLSPSSD